MNSINLVMSNDSDVPYQVFATLGVTFLCLSFPESLMNSIIWIANRNVILGESILINRLR